MMRYVNLTGHHVTVVLTTETDSGVPEFEEYPKAPEYYRIPLLYGGDSEKFNHTLGIWETKRLELIWLPDPEPDTLFIVERAIALFAERTDLVFPVERETIYWFDDIHEGEQSREVFWGLVRPMGKIEVKVR